MEVAGDDDNKQVQEGAGAMNTPKTLLSSSHGVMKLPKFSERVATLLTSEKIHLEWDKLIEECAYHVLDKYGISANLFIER